MATQQEILTQAQALVKRGHHGQAAQLAMPVARQNPRNADLLMFVAKAARDGGEFALALEALALVRRLVPSDANLANIEANTLASAGRTAEALAAFTNLLASQPDFIDGHVNRALVAQEAGDSETALELLDESLSRFPGNARLLATRGVVLKSLNRLKEALDTLDEAVTADPARARTHLSKGIVLRALNAFEQAEAALGEASRLGLNDRTLKAALGAVKLELDKVDEAEALYFEAFAAGDPEAGRALTRLRREYRGLDNPFDHYARRAKALPDNAAGWHEYLSEQLAYGEYELLKQAALEARELHPDDSRIETLEAFAAAKADRDRAAFDRLVALSHRETENFSLHCAVAETALILHEPELARKHAAEATRLAPLDQTGWCYLATAYRLLDDPREFDICDYERFVMEVPVCAPERELGSASYAAEVADMLEQLHRTSRAPGNQSLRGGTQTSGALFDRPGEGIANFRTAILAAVAKGISGLPEDRAHPFLSRVSESVAVAGSWSVRLARGDGHHVSHFHGQGWISSAYYARLPELPDEGEGTEAYIQFGAPPADWGLDLEPRRIVRPRAGHLVLFPSYMWHGTMPFTSEGVRLTAAFDFVPA